MDDYKLDIQNTRKGCLGGSDAKLLQSVAESGSIPKSALERLAVCKGLIENENITTRVMKYGDFIETSIYEHLTSGNAIGYESNPLWVSSKFSKKNVKLIAHPDIVRVDSDNATIFVFEVKATKFALQDTINTYIGQMYIEWLLAQETASKMGKNWNVRLYIVHYDSSSQDMNGEFEFDPSKMQIEEVLFDKKHKVFDVDKAMTIVNDFLDGYNEYIEKEEVDAAYLPENVKKEFDTVTNMLNEIKQRETQVEEFKKKLLTFMSEKGIRSIKNDMWSITYVGASETVSVDYKAIFSKEIEAKKPRVAKQLKEKYKKVTKKNPYVTIRVKTDK